MKSDRPNATPTHARRLRQSANAPEIAAWKCLRRLRQYDFPVRRQHPIGPYIVDFAIERAKLVIEIDGGIHRLPDVAARDAEREAELEVLGWRVMRISAEEAFHSDLLWARVSELLGL